MQIVIDIPDELYEDIKEHGLCGYCSDREIVSEAIANCTVLPKGHGDLVELGKVVDMVTEYVPDDDGSVGNTNLKDLLYEVENIKPVIEADRGDKNE